MRQLIWMLATLSLLGCSGTATVNTPIEEAPQQDAPKQETPQQEESAIDLETPPSPSTAGVEDTDSSAVEEFVIDVRSQEEWDTGHLSSAKHIPHTEIGDRIAEVTTNKDAKLVLY